MSRVITAAQATAARSWSAPEAGTGEARHASERQPAAQPTDLQREAWDEAYAAGLAAGRTAGESALRRQAERLDALLGALARPFSQLDAEVEQQLAGLALALAKQLVRRELRVEPTQVIAIVREAITVLPVSARDVRVHLHPEDAAIVREYLAPTENERAWQIVEDPVMMRGGCQVITATSRVDARLETRLGRLLTELLGDERAADGRPDAST
jgi:flagellar assembly protein FliH